MQPFALWLMVGIGLVALEMVTGTMYLLFLGISAFLGAAGAWAGLPFAWQVALFAAPAAALCIGGMRFARRRKGGTPASPDIGQTVQFEHWTSEASRLARVKYRGSHWDAEVLDPVAGQDGELLHITGVEGSRLRVKAGARPGDRHTATQTPGGT